MLKIIVHMIGLLMLLSTQQPIFAQSPFICGIDISTLTEIEASGGVFYDQDGTLIADVLAYFQSYGVNYVRLRLWNDPSDGAYNLEYNLALANRIHALGMKFLLDFHYSDTWADPANQTKPRAWAGLSFDNLKTALYYYTYDVMQAFVAQGTPPHMVQLGNEISGGMLWDDGRVWDENGWENLIALLNAGSDAVRAVAPDTQIMLHVDTGGNRRASAWFFDHVINQVDFDIIGLSYYPWWSGHLSHLQTNLSFLANRYTMPIIIVETAYPWTLAWADDVHNVVGDTIQVERNYPATPQGQQDFLHDVVQIIQDVPNDLGVGFFYWEPANITTPNLGSYWENLAQFDFEGRALPSITIYQMCNEIDAN